MGDEGLEQDAKRSRITAFAEMGGAECGAVAAAPPVSDPGLALVTERWADLPAAVRNAIVDMVLALAN